MPKVVEFASISAQAKRDYFVTGHVSHGRAAPTIGRRELVEVAHAIGRKSVPPMFFRTKLMRHALWDNLFFVPLLVFAGAGVLSAAEVAPLEHAHAHNDYLHTRPLLDALDHGFTRVAADIFLVDGELLVAHKLEEVKPGRTLEKLYLEPLAKPVADNDGQVFKNGKRFFLLLDIKSKPQATYTKLQSLLTKYAKILIAVEDGKVRQGAVTIVLTGERADIGPPDTGVRYVGLDGRIEELDSKLPAHYVPMISGKWADSFRWKGDGEMPADERAELRSIVERAHAAGRVVRFWATPEKESVWRELRGAGVDLINTDALGRLREFLLGSEK